MKDATYLAKGKPGMAFPPKETALLVIDPVNDFLSEGGAAWDMTKGTVEKNDVVNNLKRAIEGARKAGIPVLFAPMAYTEEDYASHELHRRSGINRIMFERKMFLAGSWGADFHPDLQPLPTEIVLLPHKSCDVFQTDLAEHLDRLGTTHLVIAGMTANLCCESTGRHAMERGYDVTFLYDAIGAENLPAYEASVLVNFPLIANAVMKVEEFLGAVGTASGGSVLVEAGDTVRGSDHLEIGTVEKIIPASDQHPACILVPRGMIFHTDTYVPMDAVVKRTGKSVFINVPKIVVGKMGWEELPTLASLAQKRGPNSNSVQKLYGSRSPSAAAGLVN
jgi:ureidoacrylate peracid hydrolase